MQNDNISELINRIFSPSKPIEDAELLAGRDKQLNAIAELVSEPGLHAVVYGLRGVGKSSLINAAIQLSQDSFFIKTSCLRKDTFNSLWHKALSKLSFKETRKNLGFAGKSFSENVGINLPADAEIDIADVSEILNDAGVSLVFVFDEFDVVSDEAIVSGMADAMKFLSDNTENVTVIIVGIGENIVDLIGRQASLERCLRQIHVPLISTEEAEMLILERLHILEMQIENSVLEKIIDYSSGFPHFVQLLGKFSAKEAVAEDSVTICERHFAKAVELCIENSDFTLKNTFHAAVSESSDNQFKDILFALAESVPDSEGHYRPETVLETFNKIRQTETKVESIYYNLGMLCTPDKGAILEKISRTKPKKYRFANPLMKVFIKMQMHANLSNTK